MLKNYLKIALRNLQRNKIYSTLNIAGLALGMAVALLIGLWVTDEFNTNKNFGHCDKIVELLRNGRQDGHIFPDDGIPIPLVNQLRNDPGEFASVAMAGAQLITLITVSYQSIRASLANPARTLHTEQNIATS